jgi:hypothetical protein
MMLKALLPLQGLEFEVIDLLQPSRQLMDRAEDSPRAL